MKYKYRQGDLVYIQKQSRRRSLVPRTIEVGPYKVKKYDPANLDPDKRLQLYANWIQIESEEGDLDIFGSKIIFANPELVRPENTHQEIDTGKIVPCLRNSVESKVALLVGDYPQYPAFNQGDKIKFEQNGKTFKGEVKSIKIVIKEIKVIVKVNGFKKIFEINEVDATYIKPRPFKETA